jgi:single-stranded-DNA-specific exonuclease
LRGSARSIPGIHIRDALEAVATRYPQLIDKFGGHAMAAGLSLKEENLAAFRVAFAEEVASRANEEILAGVVYSDGELGEAEMCLDTAQLLRSAGPWGQGFPEPVFDGEFRVLEMRSCRAAVHSRSKRSPSAISAVRRRMRSSSPAQPCKSPTVWKSTNIAAASDCS